MSGLICNIFVVQTQVNAAVLWPTPDYHVYACANDVLEEIPRSVLEAGHLPDRCGLSKHAVQPWVHQKPAGQLVWLAFTVCKMTQGPLQFPNANATCLPHRRDKGLSWRACANVNIQLECTGDKEAELACLCQCQYPAGMYRGQGG